MKSLAEYNAKAYRSKGMNRWRNLYSHIISIVPPKNAIEFGAGNPDFLSSLPIETEKLAIDGTDTYKKKFDDALIHLSVWDLDQPISKPFGTFESAICSDVFEHLINPETALNTIYRCLQEDGYLFAHVPNEFSLRKTISIMMGKSEAIYFSHHCEEWNHPHLHRFTDIGFQKFLGLKFKHLIRITHLVDSRTLRLLRKTGIRIPYCLEGGPTYIATNSVETMSRLQVIVDNIYKQKK